MNSTLQRFNAWINNGIRSRVLIRASNRSLDTPNFRGYSFIIIIIIIIVVTIVIIAIIIIINGEGCKGRRRIQTQSVHCGFALFPFRNGGIVILTSL